MKMVFRSFVALTFLFAATQATSCKSKTKTESNTETAAPAPDTLGSSSPVVISPDEQLQSGIRDATKDYPGVDASVSNGVVTLTGEIERSKLPALMQSVQSLRPQRVENNLTIK